MLRYVFSRLATSISSIYERKLFIVRELSTGIIAELICGIGQK